MPIWTGRALQPFQEDSEEKFCQQANQWQVAKAGGVEAIVTCMTNFPSNALVQLSALLCLIPLALDNTSLQAHVATIALPAVISALRAHKEHADVQAKGLVVLGVLGQVESLLIACVVMRRSLPTAIC